MDNELFMNAGVSHPSEMTSLSSSSLAMMNWASMQPVETSISRSLSRDCFYFEKSTELSIFDSALSSLVSSPTPSNSNFSGISGDNCVIREFIGKLGSTGDIYGTPASNGNGSSSCYATPINSPPPRPMSVTRNTTPLTEFSGDSGFADRAARLSCFGSRSFNGRTNSPLNNYNINGPVAATAATNGQPTRVSSTSALKPIASQVPAGDFTRKRKPKSKDNSPSTVSQSPNLSKVCNFSGSQEVEEKEDSGSKRSRKSEEDEEKTKPVDPYKDFIHVRARRGQATDSHSLAERVRREKISERMKLLQDLVPGCNKVTGKALMLDEIINYVQSLQQQVEFLSMKLSSVNTRLDFNMEALMSKDIFHSRNNLTHHQQVLQLESSSETLLADHHHHHHHHHTLQSNPNISSSNIMDPLETSETRSFTTFAHCTDSVSQFSTFSEDDLHSIIHNGFEQNHIL